MSRTMRSHEVHIPTWFGASELQPHVDSLVRYIRDSGYSESTLHVYRNSVAHFACWMTGCNVALETLDESHVHRFLSEHLPLCRCGPLRQRWPLSVRASLKVLLRFLRSKKLIEPQRSTDPAAVASELQAFSEYQEHVCGLTQATREVSRRRVRALLLKCFGCGPVRMDRLTDKELKRFLTRYTANCTARSRAVIYWSIRGYLHFKALTDPNAEVLCERLPRFAAWRLASLPKSLSPAESRAVLATCQGNDAVSRRDYAILRCLHDLGLRTVEVSRLQLDDFDWMAGTVRVRGKGHCVNVMPIPALTGRAIVSYLLHGRPCVASRALFLRHRPPHWSPATVFVVRAAVRYAAQRAGIADRIGGPHIFRHTVACRLAKRSASLKAIADLLRHRSLTSTRIYAKVDFPALSTVALPWPGRRP
jgi:integrase/recombinase XerD